MLRQPNPQLSLEFYNEAIDNTESIEALGVRWASMLFYLVGAILEGGEAYIEIAHMEDPQEFLNWIKELPCGTQVMPYISWRKDL